MHGKYPTSPLRLVLGSSETQTLVANNFQVKMYKKLVAWILETGHSM